MLLLVLVLVLGLFLLLLAALLAVVVGRGALHVAHPVRVARAPMDPTKSSRMFSPRGWFQNGLTEFRGTERRFSGCSEGRARVVSMCR